MLACVCVHCIFKHSPCFLLALSLSFSLSGGVTSGVSIAGSAKLQLEYNDLNPKSPVLLVKLLDILLQSSKSLSSGTTCSGGDFKLVSCIVFLSQH